MHVAVDADNLVEDDRGIGRYARAILIRALRHPDFRWTFVVRKLLTRRRALSRVLGDARVRVARSVPHDADVVWSPWNGTFLRSSAPFVATIHDATPFAFPAEDAAVRRSQQLPFFRSANASRIMVPSTFASSEVERWLGVDPAKIVITPLAVDSTFAPGPAGAPPPGLGAAPYILYVGTHDERKNTGVLIAAYESAFPDASVKLAFTRMPPSMPNGGVLVAALDDAALIALYRGAALVVMPSPYEGFGLPLLEALACGVPTLAARAGAMPEVGGEATAWVDEPTNPDAWMRAMRALMDDATARGRLAQLGPSQAKNFSWEQCTSQTLEVFRNAAAST